MKLQKQDTPFTMVANEVLYRSDLSLKAKGMFAYLFSKPEGWDFSGDRIVAEMKDKRRAIYTTLTELENAGLLKRLRQADGKMDYVIKYSDKPEENKMQKPLDGFSKEPKQQSAKMSSISNTVIDSNKDIYSNGVNEVIEAFKEVNTVYVKWFRNKTQRAACERLITTHGIDRVFKAIIFIQTSNGMAYMPTITTPLALEEKWAALEASAIKQRGVIGNKKIITV